MNKQNQWLFEAPFIPTGSYPQQANPISLEFEYESNPVIDSRIDVTAQRALMTMLRSGPPDSTTASSILSVVKSGNLVGLYQEDQRVPAMLARKMGRGWWQLLDPGQNSYLFPDPQIISRPCTFVFRRNLSRDMLIQELRQRFEGGMFVCVPKF